MLLEGGVDILFLFLPRSTAKIPEYYVKNIRPRKWKQEGRMPLDLVTQ